MQLRSAVSGKHPHFPERCQPQVGQRPDRWCLCHSGSLSSVWTGPSQRYWAFQMFQPTKRKSENNHSGEMKRNWGQKKLFWENNSASAVETHNGEVWIEGLQILDGCKAKEEAEVCLYPLLSVIEGWEAARICPKKTKKKGKNQRDWLDEHQHITKLSLRASLYNSLVLLCR